MERRRKKWMGTTVDAFLAAEMKSPAFRLAFSQARARRIKRALAEAIRGARKSRGLTQATLARRARTTQAVLSRIENPAVSYLPSVEVLARVATALHARLEIALVPEVRSVA